MNSIDDRFMILSRTTEKNVDGPFSIIGLVMHSATVWEEKGAFLSPEKRIEETNVGTFHAAQYLVLYGTIELAVLVGGMIQEKVKVRRADYVEDRPAFNLQKMSAAIEGESEGRLLGEVLLGLSDEVGSFDVDG